MKILSMILLSMIVFGICFGKDVPITRWLDPLGEKPITPQEYDARFGFPKAPLHLGVVKEAQSEDSLVDIIINSRLWEELGHEISGFSNDLESEGYSVRMDTMGSGSADELRYHLASLLPHIVGAIFIGNAPVKWFRMLEDFGYGTTIEIFPCDYFFFDLDGFWFDDDLDGLLDRHDSTTFSDADIWVGRIDPSRLTFGDPVQLLKKYFAKNSEYRNGVMPVSASALSYEYKDWHPYFAYPFSEFEHADIMRDTTLFCPADYLSRVRGTGYELVSIMSHSSPWRHYMDVGLVFNADLSILPANANFYQLFACSGARFVEQDNIANCYLFMGDRSLWVVGSAKTGSIYTLALPYFFDNLQSNCVGDAMKMLLTSWGDAMPDWHYGLTILGDPTLRTIYHSRGEVEIDTIAAAPDGYALYTSGSASDVKVRKSGSNVKIYALAQNEYWGTIDKFSYSLGSMDYITSYYSYASNTGELVLSQEPSNPTIAGEGDGLAIGNISDYPQYIMRGDGYHSHPVLPFASEPCVIYVWWEPHYPTPFCDLYLTFRHSGSWEIASGYDFRITDDEYEEIYPDAVEDSSGVMWIFWTSLRSDGAQIHCKTFADGIFGDDNYICDGSFPTAVVAGDGEIYLFWRGQDGYLYSSQRSTDWSAPQRIWNEHTILEPHAIIDNDGEPVVLFNARHSSQNTEIWALSRQSEEWLPTRLTFSNSPDFSPDGTVLDDNSLLLVWINGSAGELSARWNLLDLNGIAENSIQKPEKQKIRTYPSPFNSVLDIEWESGERTVKIFDISSRCVATLHGNGKVLWNAECEPNGMYLVNVEGIGTRKVFHIK